MGMKTAISIPDEVFRAAESAAKRLGMSRSEFYTRAVRAYLESDGGKGITEKVNEVLATEASSLDPAAAAMQWASLPPEAW
jgi:metal-responsive CopG/Arc/MetJ family transcriptional regulator